MTWSFETSIVHLLHRATQTAHDIFLAPELDLQITPRQYVLLATVSAHEGASQTRIVEVSGIDRSTTAEMMRRLLTAGLLKRRRSKEDARAYEVFITPLGEKTLALAEAQAKKVETVLLAPLSPADRSALARMLATLSHATSGG